MGLPWLVSGLGGVLWGLVRRSEMGYKLESWVEGVYLCFEWHLEWGNIGFDILSIRRPAAIGQLELNSATRTYREEFLHALKYVRKFPFS